MFKKQFLKTVSAVLVITFSWSQFAFAVDVRQMLVDAKLRFAEEDARRPGGALSPEQLAKSESQQQETVAQQQAITENKFSLTTRNGDILNYVGGALKGVERKDGTRLSNIQLDAQNNIVAADLRLSDGSIQVFQNGAVLGYQTPDGRQVLYEGGRIKKVVSKDGTETSYAYTIDAQGRVTETVLENSSHKSHYDAQGKLFRSILKADGAISIYQAGIIKEIIRPDGSKLIFSAEVLPEGLRVRFSHVVDAAGNRHFYSSGRLSRIDLNSGMSLRETVASADQTSLLSYKVYGADGALISENGVVTHPSLAPAVIYPHGPVDSKIPFQWALYANGLMREALTRDGNRLYFNAAGFLEKVLGADGRETSFNFTESQLQNITGSRIVKNGLSGVYDAEGRLSSVSLNGLTIHYKKSSNAINWIEKEDGTELYSLVFDGQGRLTGAEIVSPSGEVRKYENGKLIWLKQQDETQLFYFDAKPTKLITSKKIAYNFQYAPDKIEATLDAAMIVSDALTPVKMQYDTAFNLKKLVRQNNEILSYLGGDLKQIETPNEAPKVFDYVKDASGKVLSYTVTQSNVVTSYDADNNPVKSVISASAGSPHALIVLYRYGKIREIQKNGVLTFKYGYSFDPDGTEVTTIRDLEEKTTKVYKKGLLFTDFSEETGVLSSYSYQGDKVSRVTVTRLGRMLHTYSYAYENGLTIVTDEEGGIRTYSAQRKLLFLEKDNKKYAYSYSLSPGNEEIVEEKLIQRKLASGAVAHYDLGKVTRVQLVDGTWMTDIVVKEGVFEKGTVHLADGSRKIFSRTALLEEILASGTHFYYEGGRLKKAVEPLGRTLEYSYENDKSGLLAFIWVKKGTVNLKYSVSGQLLGVKVDGITVAEDGQREFFDSTAIRHAVTRVGDTSLRASDKKMGNAASYFDGMGDELDFQDSSDWALGSGDFTIETWAKVPASGTGESHIVSNWAGVDGAQWFMGLTVDRRLFFYGGAYLYASESISAEAWHHFAAVRSGNVLTLYVDGRAAGSQTVSFNATSGTGIVIGNRSSAPKASAFKGSLDELRISKGIARWTSGFVPSEELYQPDVHTKLLLHFDASDKAYYAFRKTMDAQGNLSGYSFEGTIGTVRFDAQGRPLSASYAPAADALKAFQDAASSNYIIKAIGDATMTRSAYTLGNASAYFDGIGDELQLPDTPDWALGAGDFTIETWARVPVDTGESHILSNWAGADGAQWMFGLTADRRLMFYGGTWLMASTAISADAWHHLAAVRSGNTLTLYVNGQAVASQAVNFNLSSNLGLVVGNRGASPKANPYKGWLDELRLSKGVARWTGNFTPAAANYSPDAQTKLLLHFDDGDKMIFDFAEAAIRTLDGNADLLASLLYHLRVQASLAGIPAWAAVSQDAILDASAIVAQEYSASGILETQTKTDRTVTLFENNKPSKVLSEGGEVLIEYFYDEKGNPTRVHLKNARNVLPHEVLKARQKIESARADSLKALAAQQRLAYESIASQVVAQKTALGNQMGTLQGQYNDVQGASAKGKKAKSQKGDALNQIGGAMDQVSAALATLNAQEADAYAALGAQIQAVSGQIKADARAAFDELSKQEAALKKEILRQEISPIVYDYYRRTLGRDPSTAEYDSWLGKIDFDSGKIKVGEEAREEVTPGASIGISNGNYLSVANTVETNFGTGDFTIDFWTKLSTLSGQQTFVSVGNGYVNGPDPYKGIMLTWCAGNFYLYVTGSVYYAGHAWSPDVNAWHHLALVRQGSQLKIFVNGVQNGPTETNTGNVNPAIETRIGSASNTFYSWPFHGLMDQVRFSKGVARWTDGFAPPTTHYQTDANTTLLLRARPDGTYRDDSGLNRAIAAQGPVSVNALDYKVQTRTTIYTPILKDLVPTLVAHLNALPELTERTAYVNSVKSKVTSKIQRYLAMTQVEKSGFAGTLGLTQAELVALNQADADKVLNWLNSRSLHFGQSAFLSLEAMLDAKGISYAREDLAEKAILVDVLTGIISPLDDGDLVLSVFALNKVAQSYGLTLSGANLTWEDLLAIYQSSPTAKIVAHVNGNHFVVVQSVTADSISYMDPGRGKDKQNEVMALSKKDFLKGWKGNVILEQAKLQTVTGHQAKTLSIEQTQKTRGAFFFFFIPAIIGALTSIGGAVASVLSGIGTIIGSVGPLVGVVFSGIGQFLGGVGGLLQGIGSALFQGISFAASSLWGAVGNVGSFLSQTVFGSLAKAGFGDVIFQTAVKIGVNFGVSKGLESLGVNPAIAGFVGSLASGAVVGGMTPISAVQAAQGVTQATMIQASVLQTLTIQGVGRLGMELGLDAGLTNIVGLSLGTIQGNIITNPGTTLEAAFSSLKPQLFGSLAQWGVDKLGPTLGIDSRTSTLIGVPIGAGVGTMFDAGRAAGVNVINSVQAGMIQGAIAYGLNFTGTQNPFLGSLMSRDITNNLALAIGKNGLFNTVFNILGKTALNVVNVVGGTVRTVFEGITSFGTTIQQKGLAGALESLFTSIFSRNAQEAILQKGGTQELLNATPMTPVTLRDGRTAKELKINEGNSLFFDDASRFIGRKDEGIDQLGDLGYDSSRNFALLEGKVFADLDGDLDLYGGVKDGQFISIKIDGPSGTVLQVDPEKANAPIYIEGPKAQQPNSFLSFWGNVFKLLPIGLSLFIGEGKAEATEQVINTTTQALQASANRLVYALANGIANPLSDKSVPPDYIQNLEKNLKEQSNNQIISSDLLPIPLYQRSFQFTGINMGIDAVKWIIESQDSIKRGQLVNDVFDNLHNYFWKNGLNPYYMQRPIVGMGYSGGFIPLVEAIAKTGSTYNFRSLVALGAATISITQDLASAVTSVIQAIIQNNIDNLQKSLPRLGSTRDVIDRIINSVQANLIDRAFGLLQDELERITRQSDPMNTLVLPDLSNTSVQQIVNVWGTKDILYQTGIGGKRQALSGITGNKLLNIEITGATHFDYMLRGATDPNPPDSWNNTVSTWVTRLIQRSDTNQRLNAFLNDPSNYVRKDDARGVWIVELPGFEGRR